MKKIIGLLQRIQPAPNQADLNELFTTLSQHFSDIHQRETQIDEIERLQGKLTNVIERDITDIANPDFRKEMNKIERDLTELANPNLKKEMDIEEKTKAISDLLKRKIEIQASLDQKKKILLDLQEEEYPLDVDLKEIVNIVRNLASLITKETENHALLLKLANRLNAVIFLQNVSKLNSSDLEKLDAVMQEMAAFFTSDKGITEEERSFFRHCLPTHLTDLAEQMFSFFPPQSKGDESMLILSEIMPNNSELQKKSAKNLKSLGSIFNGYADIARRIFPDVTVTNNNLDCHVVQSKPEEMEEFVGLLKTLNTAYIRRGDKLFYFDRANQQTCELKTSADDRRQFDILFQPVVAPRKLTEQELTQIQKLTKHNRTIQVSDKLRCLLVGQGQILNQLEGANPYSRKPLATTPVQNNESKSAAPRVQATFQAHINNIKKKADEYKSLATDSARRKELTAKVVATRLELESNHFFSQTPVVQNRQSASFIRTCGIVLHTAKNTPFALEHRDKVWNSLVEFVVNLPLALIYLCTAGIAAGVAKAATGHFFYHREKESKKLLEASEEDIVALTPDRIENTLTR